MEIGVNSNSRAWRQRKKRPCGLGHSPARTLLWTGLFLAMAAPVMGQDPPRKKPVLIRADVTEEATPEAKIITPNAVEASHHQKVGDFYFRRKNYKAAAERYRDAVLYDPKSPERVLKLVRALEKLKLFQEAAQAFQEYVERNPGSPQEDEFRKRARKLEEKESEESP